MFNLAKLFNKQSKELTPTADVIDLTEYRSKREEELAHKRIQEEIDRDLLEQWLSDRQQEMDNQKLINESIEAYLYRLRVETTRMEAQFSEYSEPIKDFIHSLDILEKEIDKKQS